MTPNNLPPNSDHLDRAFSAYFQAQVPTPWPTPPMPVETRTAATASWSNRTRFTLAASVAALFAFALWLSAGGTAPVSTPKGGGLFEKGTADGTELKKHMPADHPEK
jgi:hypothetical protein